MFKKRFFFLVKLNYIYGCIDFTSFFGIDFLKLSGPQRAVEWRVEYPTSDIYVLKLLKNFLQFLGWIYVNSEGVKVKSIRAAMRYEAIKTSEKEIRQRKMNSTL